MRFIVLSLIALAALCAAEEPFNVLFSWKKLDWIFESDSMRKYFEEGNFSTSSNPLGVSAWKDKLFITVPRWKKGVPANLNYIDLKEAARKSEKSPPLLPYPDWKSNDITKDGAIVNILRTRIDACDRLWAVDSGVDDIWGESRVVQPPKLIAIDLHTNKIIHSYTFKDSVLKANTFFAESVIDVDPNRCDDAYVYNSDLGDYGLVIYSLAKNDSWRVENNYFRCDPLNGDYFVNGIAFQWPDGIIGLALTPPRSDGTKTLYFHAMSSTTEFEVSTKVLKNEELLAERLSYQHFHEVGKRGHLTQGTSMALDPRTGILYMPQLNKNALACWDTHHPLNPETFRIVAQDNTSMIYPNDVALDTASQKLYLVTDDLGTFQYADHDWDRTNFYIHVATLDDLTEACKGRHPR